MARTTGKYQTTNVGGEAVRAFTPDPLPPAKPALSLEGTLAALHTNAVAAVARLSVAGTMVPDADWFLYGFVRKEAVVTSQIEGTQATLRDVLTFEATHKAERPDDVQEVCNYVDALTYTRREIRNPEGLPLTIRLLKEAHKRLMRGVRGAEKMPGEIRTSQNWIGGTRPGNAAFVPPPPNAVPEALSALECWIHGDDPLPPLVRAGLAHVQFETIHPFLDGNGRIGRLLITLLVEHWGLLPSPLLYLSLAFKRHQQEYYRRLSAVRTDGDWEGWTAFFLECVREAADDGVTTAQRLFALLNKDRQRLLNAPGATVPAIRLFDALPGQPVVTLAGVMKALKTTKPTASKAISMLVDARILKETTGKQRDRVYAYHGYLRLLTGDAE
ncbi:MAG: Fic family protein [Planctomycetia bacterium]